MGLENESLDTALFADDARPGSAAKRATCERCLRPLCTCICQWVTPVAHRVQVLILQHPLEVAHAKGSARLLHLCLPHSRMLTGEVFDIPACLAWMDAQGAQEVQQAHFGGATPGHPRHNILLYPGTETGQSHNNQLPSALALQTVPDLLQRPSQLRLIVLDGTWRKSRKMLCLNPALQQLPRLSLAPLQASRYLIRQAHRPGQLSTLEATCAALAQLETQSDQFEPLLKAFDGFVAQQAGYRWGPDQPLPEQAIHGPGRVAATGQCASSD